MALVKRCADDARGVVYAEFIMAFTPFFLLFLGIIQLAFIGTGGIVVQTAAMKSARAAVVILPDDRFFYEGEKEMLLDFNGQSDNTQFQAGLGQQLGKGEVSLAGGGAGNFGGGGRPTAGGGGGNAGGGGSTGGGGQQSGNGGPRLNAIRMAAQLTLAPLAPDPKLVATWIGTGLTGGLVGAGGLGVDRYSLRHTGIGESPTLRFLTGMFAYNAAAAAINFPRAPRSAELWNAGDDFKGQVVFKHKQPVTVRISYLFPCSVPLVNMIICRKFEPKNATIGSTISQVREGADRLRDPLGTTSNPSKASPEEQALITELSAGVPDPDLLDTLLSADQGRFYVLRSEMTLPIQSAMYAYPTADKYKEQDRQQAQQQARNGNQLGSGSVP